MKLVLLTHHPMSVIGDYTLVVECFSRRSDLTRHTYQVIFLLPVFSNTCLRLRESRRRIELNLEWCHLCLCDVFHGKVSIFLCKLDCMLPHSILKLLLGLQFSLIRLVIVNFLPKICKEVVYLRFAIVVLLLY